MRNKLIISEEEKRSILYQHKSNFGWLNEQETTNPESVNTTTTPTDASKGGVTVDSDANQRWKKLKQEGKMDLALQARINDTCPNLVLQTVLENYPKARTGSYPNYKLKEDSKFGSGTEAAAKACKPHFGKSQTASVQATGQGTTIAEPKIGEPLTADDIATLTN
jgi:hypothetical protein